MHEVALKREAAKVIAYIEKYVTRVGTERKEEVLSLFDSMQQFFPSWGIATCPIMHPDIFYISRNCESILGHNRDTFLRNTRIDKFFELINDSDKDDLYNCMSFMHDTLEGVAPDDHQHYRHIFHYRFRKENGQWIYLHDEKATLVLRDSGNLYYSLFRDLTSERAFSGVKVEVYNQQGVISKVKEYKPSARRTALSRRENDLVTLIRQGLTTKEIAWHLNISHNTVRNIKSKLFEKFKVSNNVELLNLAG